MEDFFQEKNIGTKHKALKINLEPQIYGSFAEIGAGQDVAAVFFKAGGASGTIAKTMSAYDMTFSDAIYGPVKSGRYVSEERLMSMLSHEYDLLIERLDEKRGANTKFFSFANTVVALNYQKNNTPHGWIGLRYQLEPRGSYHEVVIHVQMLDNDNLQQQQALGVVGTNLIYGCFKYYKDPERLLKSLMDDLTPERIQIDMIRFEGEAFKNVDGRLMSLRLVQHGFSNAALFSANGKTLQPTEALYKKHIVLMRGRFRPVVDVHLDMLENGVKQYLKEPDIDQEKLVILTELTLQSLKERDANDDAQIDEKDFLDRVDILCSLGQTVMISNFHEYYKVVAYLSKITKLKIGIILGFSNLEYIFEEDHYKNLPGGILESFATLFSKKVKLYIYPTLRNGQILNSLHFSPSYNIIDLFRYLIANRKIEDIHHYNEKNLHTSTDNILQQIKEGNSEWEQHLPTQVAQIIKDKCLFGFNCMIPENTNS